SHWRGRSCRLRHHGDHQDAQSERLNRSRSFCSRRRCVRVEVWILPKRGRSSSSTQRGPLRVGIRLASYLFAQIIKIAGSGAGSKKGGEDQRLARFFSGKDEGWLDSARSFFPVSLADFWTIHVCALGRSVKVYLLCAENKKLGRRATLSAECLGFSPCPPCPAEALSDYQKLQFKNDPEYKGKFMDGQSPLGAVATPKLPRGDGSVVGDTGSRPSYPKRPGEDRVWTGEPAVHHIPHPVRERVPIMLDQQHDEKYGDDPRYREWKENTPMIVPDLSKV
ncbi:unnamed protein product, partial [Hapterophycus canaliculatus]